MQDVNGIIQRSWNKPVNIYLESCRSKKQNRYISCRDAYEYTWKKDFSGEISYLKDENKIKLYKTMGFCPHIRCQLGNVSNPINGGSSCPKGLCYTKIENGSLSFGACCFTDGFFNSGQLIGYFNKTVSVPKPIYKHSRIVLGDIVGGMDESIDSFINANLVSTGLIATQCPMLSTLTDVFIMIIEQNVKTWIQLAPKILKPISSKDKQCILLGNSTLSNHFHWYTMQDSPQYFKNSKNFIKKEINITYYIREGGVGKKKIRFWFNGSASCDESLMMMNESDPSMTCPPDSSRWIKKTKSFDWIWYNNWMDFSIPPESDQEDVYKLARYASMSLRQNESVAVSCYSGRGRSGTLIALIAGLRDRINSHDELVNLIVRLRENRDGMVEIPSQYRFVALQLGLNDPAEVSLIQSVFGHISCLSSPCIENNINFSNFVVFLTIYTALLLGIFRWCCK